MTGNGPPVTTTSSSSIAVAGRRLHFDVCLFGGPPPLRKLLYKFEAPFFTRHVELNMCSNMEFRGVRFTIWDLIAGNVMWQWTAPRYR